MMLSYARRFWINEKETSCFSFYDDDDEKKSILFAHTQLDVTLIKLFIISNVYDFVSSEKHKTYVGL